MPRAPEASGGTGRLLLALEGRQLSLLWNGEGEFHLQPTGLVPQPVCLVLHQELPDGNMVRKPKLKRDPSLRFSLDISAPLLLALSYPYLSCPPCFTMGSATHPSMRWGWLGALWTLFSWCLRAGDFVSIFFI